MEASLHFLQLCAQALDFAQQLPHGEIASNDWRVIESTLHSFWRGLWRHSLGMPHWKGYIVLSQEHAPGIDAAGVCIKDSSL